MPGRLWIEWSDETCIGKDHSHMAIGGLLMPADAGQRLDAAVRWWRAADNMTSEMKWSKLTALKFPEYRRFVNLALQRLRRQEIAFHSIVLERDKIDYRHFHDGDADLGFDRFYYNLVLHRVVPLLGIGDRLILRPDERSRKRTSTATLEDLRRCLNNGIRKAYGYPRNRVVAIEPCDSKATNLGQLNDVILGAVGFHNNRRDLAEKPNPSSVALAKHIAERVGLSTLRVHTARDQTHFGIWPFELQEPRFRGRMRKAS